MNGIGGWKRYWSLKRMYIHSFTAPFRDEHNLGISLRVITDEITNLHVLSELHLPFLYEDVGA